MRGSGSCQIISAVKQQTRRCQIENRYSAWIDWLENVSCDECGKVVLISYNFLLPLLEHSNSAKCPGQLDETRCEQWGPSLLVGFWNAFGVVVFQNVVPAEKQFFQFRFRTRPSLNGSRSPSYFLDTLPVTGFLGTHSEAFISQIPLEHLQFGPMHEANFLRQALWYYELWYSQSYTFWINGLDGDSMIFQAVLCRYFWTEIKWHAQIDQSTWRLVLDHENHTGRGLVFFSSSAGHWR